MIVSIVLLVIAALLAVVAVCAAVVARKALAEVRSLRAEAERRAPAPEPLDAPTPAPATLSVTTPHEREFTVVEGRVIVPATRAEAVAAVMSGPRVRMAVFASGMLHALRPASRDRIAALMRREFRDRRRTRMRAARTAARAGNPGAAT